jgi:hypothetical protein
VQSFPDTNAGILMKDSSEAKATCSQSTAVGYFRSIFFVCLVVALLVVYIASEYFQNARLSQLISFQAWDAPGPMPDVLMPSSLGNHFFGDFLLTFRLSQQSSPYFADGFVPFFYLPISAVLLGPFVLFDYWTAIVLFFATCGILLVTILSWGFSDIPKNSRRAILSLIILSGPMFSAIDRGNVSLILTLGCVFAVLNLRRGNPYMAAIAFGLSAAMKGYPILFLLVFVRRREWKPLSLGILVFLLSTLIPLLFYKRGFSSNLKELINEFQSATNPIHALNIRAFNHSLFSFFDTCRTSLPHAVTSFFNFTVIHYSLFGLLFTAGLLSHAISKHASDFESLLLITVPMVSIPQVVGYYVLLLYFVPLVFAWSENLQLDLKMKLIMAALAVVMVPKGIPLWSPFGPWSQSAATYTSFLNPLCALFVASICIYSINKRRFLAFLKQDIDAGC